MWRKMRHLGVLDLLQSSRVSGHLLLGLLGSFKDQLYGRPTPDLRRVGAGGRGSWYIKSSVGYGAAILREWVAYTIRGSRKFTRRLCT